ncbi:uncharacterized protein LOC114207088 [Eumetopias jubatus]|uniref:uncharacterized protein LOC114207088 n=1 Tax=Eumetopias jubatus TaxID=34886 RepID=UPI001016D9F3|nr:uncharacterized protein LOC114207088 [Eumetopias jubatus]
MLLPSQFLGLVTCYPKLPVLPGTAWAFHPLVSGGWTPPARPWGFRDRERAGWSQSPSSVPRCETTRPRKPRAATPGDTYTRRRRHGCPSSRHRAAGEGQGGNTRARRASLPARRARSWSTEPLTRTPFYLHRHECADPVPYCGHHWWPWGVSQTFLPRHSSAKNLLHPTERCEWRGWSRPLAGRGRPDYPVHFLLLRRRLGNCALKLETSEDDVFALLNAYGLYLYY